MRIRYVLLLSLCAAGGCSSFLEQSVRNLTEAPVRGLDDLAYCSRNQEEAIEAWQVERRKGPDRYSRDYGEGFVAGYADYLDAGGTGYPPAVPPFRYRLVCCETPEGARAVEEWYAGFRHGAEAARASGGREARLVPLSAPPINALTNRPRTRPAAPPKPPAEVPAPEVPEQLPPPRQAEPAP
jgi:hypothetical protein